MPALTIRLHPSDNVVVARLDLLPGTELPEERVAAVGPVPAGHKIATAPVAPGEPVRKYGQILGFAIEAIRPGEHVHTHNLAMVISTATTPSASMRDRPITCPRQGARLSRASSAATDGWRRATISAC